MYVYLNRYISIYIYIMYIMYIYIYGYPPSNFRGPAVHILCKTWWKYYTLLCMSGPYLLHNKGLETMSAHRDSGSWVTILRGHRHANYLFLGMSV